MISVGEVVEDSEIDGENAHGCKADGNGGYNPMYRRRRGPAEHEETDGHEGTLVAREVEASFGGIREFVVFFCYLFLVDADDGKYGRGDENGREDCATFLNIEAVVGSEDQRYRSKGEVKDSP